MSWWRLQWWQWKNNSSKRNMRVKINPAIDNDKTFSNTKTKLSSSQYNNCATKSNRFCDSATDGCAREEMPSGSGAELCDHKQSLILRKQNNPTRPWNSPTPLPCTKSRTFEGKLFFLQLRNMRTVTTCHHHQPLRNTLKLAWLPYNAMGVTRCNTARKKQKTFSNRLTSQSRWKLVDVTSGGRGEISHSVVQGKMALQILGDSGESWRCGELAWTRGMRRSDGGVRQSRIGSLGSRCSSSTERLSRERGNGAGDLTRYQAVDVIWTGWFRS